MKVIDFGIATDADNGPAATEGATLRYASPEQLHDGAVDASSDVYSAGVLIHEVFTQSEHEAQNGEPLRLVSGSRGPSRSAGLEPMVQPPSLEWEGVPPELRAIIEKCISVAPGDRYANGVELRDDVRAFLSGRPVLAYSTAPSDRARLDFRRNSRRIALASALVVAGLLLPRRPTASNAAERPAEVVRSEFEGWVSAVMTGRERLEAYVGATTEWVDDASASFPDTTWDTDRVSSSLNILRNLLEAIGTHFLNLQSVAVWMGADNSPTSRVLEEHSELTKSLRATAGSEDR